MNGERFEQITVTVEGGIATVTLNRPDRYNALCSLISTSWAMYSKR